MWATVNDARRLTCLLGISVEITKRGLYYSIYLFVWDVLFGNCQHRAKAQSNFLGFVSKVTAENDKKSNPHHNLKSIKNK